MDRTQRAWLFYGLLAMFFVIFLVTMLGVIGVIKLADGYLGLLFTAVIAEIAGIGVAWFKRKDIFSESFDIDPTRYEPNKDARKVLATFWHYQCHHFGPDHKKGLWMARLPQDEHEIPSFYRGVAELLDVGLLSMDAASHQARLNMEGLAYGRRHD